MSDVKRPLANGFMHAHAARDFHRGFATKNVVKGAGGGARGVDFQDTEADFKERLEKAGPATSTGMQDKDAASSADDAQSATQAAMSQAAQDAANAEAVVVDAQLQRDKIETPQEIKDEEKKRKKLILKDDDHREEQAEIAALPDEEITGEPEGDAQRAQMLHNIQRLLQDPTQERRAFGAFVLTEPELMRKTLGTPVRVAKHLLVLSSRMLKEKQQERGHVVDYLAGTFVALGPDFGRRAFKDFSANIGIGSIYPLEVHEKLILVQDNFLPTTKCRFTSGKRMLTTKVKVPIVLEYPEDIRITEFAVKGGSKSGYQLAPMKEKGKYGLKLFEVGEFRVLMLGIDTMGFQRLEEIRITVEPNPALGLPKPSGPKRYGVGLRPLPTSGS